MRENQAEGARRAESQEELHLPTPFLDWCRQSAESGRPWTIDDFDVINLHLKKLDKFVGEILDRSIQRGYELENRRA